MTSNDIISVFKQAMEGKGELTPSQEKKIIDFVTNTYNLDDSTFHAFCDALEVDPHEAEEVVYAHVSKAKKEAASLKDLMHSGKAKNKGTYRPDQMDKGKKVEHEHTEGAKLDKPVQDTVARKISKDHLKEIPDYYTRLKHMEEQAKKSATYSQGFNDFCKRAGINPLYLIKQ